MVEQADLGAGCLLSNGDCPKRCALYEIAVEETAMVGKRFMLDNSRRRVREADQTLEPIYGLSAETITEACFTEP